MIRAILLAFVASLGLINNVAHCESASLGVIVPVSGPYAHFGDAGRIGLEMGLKADSKDLISVKYEDSQYEAAKSVSAYSKLIEIDHATGLIVLGSPPSSAVIPLAEKRGIPVFAWTPSKKITGGTNGVIRLMTSATEQGQTMAAEVRRREYNNIGYFAAQNEFAQSVKEGFLASYGSSGILVNEEVNPTEQDFRTSLIRARSLGVKAIGICLNTGQIPAFIRQVRQLGLSVPLFGCHAMSSAAVLSALKSNKLSAWFVEGVVGKTFQEEFEKRSPDSSGIWLAAAFHDLGRLLSRIPLNRNFIAAVAGKALDDSAFGRSKIVKGADDIYLEVQLGITLMDGDRFIRNSVVQP